MKKILIIDDEEDIAFLLEYNLKKAGYDTITEYNGEDGYKTAIKELPDLILLDIMLPNMTGNELYVKLAKTKQTENIPIIMISARGEESDIISGLSKGVKDYVTKPFSIKILIAKINNLLAGTESPRELKYHDIKIDLSGHVAYINGQEVELTLSQFNYLRLFLKNPGRTFTRHELMDNVKGTDYPAEPRSVDQAIKGLRDKLTDGSVIQTVRGIGYRLRKR